MTREEYFANLKSAKDALHYGVGHDKGGHLGRYPYGSGKTIKKGTTIKIPMSRRYGSSNETPRLRVGGMFVPIDEKSYNKSKELKTQENQNRSTISKIVEPYDLREGSYKTTKDLNLMTPKQQVELFNDIVKKNPSFKTTMLKNARTYNKVHNIKQTNDLTKNLQSAMSLGVWNTTGSTMIDAVWEAGYDGFMLTNSSKYYDELSQAYILEPYKNLKANKKDMKLISTMHKNKE